MFYRARHGTEWCREMYSITQVEASSLKIPQGRAWYLIVHGFLGERHRHVDFPYTDPKKMEKERLNILGGGHGEN